MPVQNSMIIYNFNFINAVFSPFKTDSPLIIDVNAVLPFAYSLQRFKTVRGWDAQVIQSSRFMEHDQLSLCNALDIVGQFL
jgi:hypothetical protein